MMTRQSPHHRSLAVVVVPEPCFGALVPMPFVQEALFGFLLE